MGRILSQKIWGTGSISEKTEALYEELNERRKQSPVVTL